MGNHYYESDCQNIFQRLMILDNTCGLYYKHVTIVNYASSSINTLKASLNDNARVIIYDHHMFIAQATDDTHNT